MSKWKPVGPKEESSGQPFCLSAEVGAQLVAPSWAQASPPLTVSYALHLSSMATLPIFGARQHLLSLLLHFIAQRWMLRMAKRQLAMKRPIQRGALLRPANQDHFSSSPPSLNLGAPVVHCLAPTTGRLYTLFHPPICLSCPLQDLVRLKLVLLAPDNAIWAFIVPPSQPA
jgi:hypothetical protein